MDSVKVSFDHGYPPQVAHTNAPRNFDIAHWQLGWRRQQHKFNLAIAFTLLLTVLVGPFIFAFAAFQGSELSELAPRHWMHIGINALCNLTCVVVAAHVSGSMTMRLYRSLFAMFLVHGIWIITILAFRLYYSRPIMMLAFFTSMALITVVAMIVERLRPQCVGVVTEGVTEEFMSWLGPNVAWISSPDFKVTNYDVILVNWSVPLEQKWVAFASQAILSGCDVRHIAKHVEDRSGRVSAEHFDPSHAGDIGGGVYQNYFKRVFDLAIVFGTIPITLPLLLLSMLAVACTSSGPVFFVQNRIGYRGREFRIYKLRTMVHRAEQHQTATAEGDHRITSMGRVLRRLRLDEIPQLLNVFIGNMSIVGPRPEQTGLTDRYNSQMPAFRYRSMVPPGITGWAQVKCGYATNDAESREKLMHDLYYVKNTSFLLDLWIIFMTTRAILSGSGVR
jgi:lipopolysaccharide/colanic/teichoic acid biosynthesis glycosyltransferase